MKYEEIAKLIERRVQRGDYLLNDLPGERELATEQGVSHMTARRAVQQLVRDNVLIRKPNGRVAVNAQRFGSSGRLQTAILTPVFPSRVYDRWRYALDYVCRERGDSLRPVPYVHWDDPAIFEALERFDAVFLLTPSEEVPAWVAERLRNAPRAVVALEADLTPIGIYSIRPFAVRFIDRMLDYAKECGYQRIDCLNAQPLVHEITERIERWHAWRDINGLEGELMNEPVRSYEFPLPQAYEVVRQRLSERGIAPGTAIFCTTGVSAVGAMRALHEHGIAIGSEVGVCTLNDADSGRYTIPSLTLLEAPDLLELTRQCLDDIQAAEGGRLPLKFREAKDASLFIGESILPLTKGAPSVPA